MELMSLPTRGQPLAQETVVAQAQGVLLNTKGEKIFLRVFHEKIYYVTSGGLAYPDTSILALNISAFYPVRKPTTMANTKREPS